MDIAREPFTKSVHMPPKPQLTRSSTTSVSAAVPQKKKRRDSRPRYEWFAPCFPVTRRFKKKHYLTSFKLCARGFIRRFERSDDGITIPAPIASLCVDFAYEREAGLFQIGYELHRAMKKTRRHSVTRQTVTALVALFLKLGDSEAAKAEVQLYVDEMVRLRYLSQVKLMDAKDYHTLFVTSTPVPKRIGTEQPLYEIPVDAVLQFGVKHSGRTRK